PMTLSRSAIERVTEDFRRTGEQAGIFDRARLIAGRGFMGVNGGTDRSDAQLIAFLNQYIATRLQPAEIDPDVWLPVVIRDVDEASRKLADVATAKYSYAQLDDFTDLIGRTLLGVSQTSRFERKGVISQAIYLEYSQERLAAYGLQLSNLAQIVNARNIT